MSGQQQASPYTSSPDSVRGPDLTQSPEPRAAHFPSNSPYHQLTRPQAAGSKVGINIIYCIYARAQCGISSRGWHRFF